MRIAYIAAGAGPGYCGACHRDVTLVRGLRAKGHDAYLLPLYTPLRVDGEDPSLDRMFYGGINAYLQQRFVLFRRTPKWVDWLLDRPKLLRAVSSFAINTRPEDLGEMTVSVLRGSEGHQKKELDKLMDFLASGERPDLVNLTNSLLSGLAPEIKRRLGLPVLCTLQGEESFVSRLPQPHQDEAIACLRQNARSIDLFLAPHVGYAEMMMDLLEVPRDRFAIVPPGVDGVPYQGPAQRKALPFRVGFLSRLSPVKGLDILAEAFCRMETARSTGAFLAVAGTVSPGERAFMSKIRERLAKDGLLGRLEECGELDLPGKVRFLKSCHVFCQPSRFPEQRGIACLEAMAAATPVVVPRTGIFPEILNAIGGGLLVRPEDVDSVASALTELRDHPEIIEPMGRAGQAGVARYFSQDAMVSASLDAYSRWGTTLSGSPFRT